MEEPGCCNRPPSRGDESDALYQTRNYSFGFRVVSGDEDGPAVLSRPEGSGLQVGEPQRVEGFHKARTWKKSGYFFARGAVSQVYHLPEGRVGVHGVYDYLAFE